MFILYFFYFILTLDLFIYIYAIVYIIYMAIYGLNSGLDHLDGFIRCHLLNKLEIQWGHMVFKGYFLMLV